MRGTSSRLFLSHNVWKVAAGHLVVTGGVSSGLSDVVGMTSMWLGYERRQGLGEWELLFELENFGSRVPIHNLG